MCVCVFVGRRESTSVHTCTGTHVQTCVCRCHSGYGGQRTTWGSWSSPSAMLRQDLSFLPLFLQVSWSVGFWVTFLLLPSCSSSGIADVCHHTLLFIEVLGIKLGFWGVCSSDFSWTVSFLFVLWSWGLNSGPKHAASLAHRWILETTGLFVKDKVF